MVNLTKISSAVAGKWVSVGASALSAQCQMQINVS